MISKNYRYIISNTIQAMESGQYQDFCRDILPFYNDLYANFERHGATQEGKTRKGTPDFIKTLDDGSEIGLQCSVTGDYWDKPKDGAKTKWKPKDDFDKCLKNMSKPSEVVLCCNRIQPTNYASIKSDLIQCTQGKVNISIFTLADFENKLMELVEKQEARPIFKVYLPELYDIIILPKDFQKAYLEKICVEKDPLLASKDLKEIIEKSFDQFSNLKEREDYVLSEGAKISFRYEIHPIPGRFDILRDLSKDSVLCNPLGKVISLIGVAKVGKTALVSQVAEEWLLKEYSVKWFNCPVDLDQHGNFKNHFLRNILSLLLPSSVASQLVLGQIGLEQFDFRNLELRDNGNFVYVVDNCEVLSDKHLRFILQFLNEIKSSKLESKAGFVFISNKSIKHLSAVVCEEIVAPYFNRKELQEFLLKRFPENQDVIEEKYISYLLTLSSGHPLIAHAISKKYPTFNELIVATLKRDQLIDDGLSREAEELLFNDILADNDFLNFVLRLSPLVFRSREKVLDAIMQIKPEIGKTRKIIVDRLYGSVLEGDIQQGFSVAPLYKKIADAKNSEAQRKRIYEVCAEALLTPKDRTLIVEDVAEGAFYAVLVGQKEKALFWATMLLQNISNKTFKPEVIRNILIQFEPIVYIKSDNDNVGSQSLRVTFLLAMAMNYINIKENQRALEIMKMIKSSWELINIPGGEIFNVLQKSVDVFEALIIAEGSPKESIRLLIDMDWQALSLINPNHRTFDDCLQILKELIKRIPAQELPERIFSKINLAIDITNEIHIERLIHLGMLIGTKAHKEKMDIIGLKKIINDGSPLGELSGQFAKIQYILMEEQYDETNKQLKGVLQCLRKTDIVLQPILSFIYCLAGDMYFGLKNNKKAKKFYSKTLRHVRKDLENFDYGWANYRLGTLYDDPNEAVRCFVAASQVFNQLQIDYEYAIALGEIAVISVQQNKYPKFMEICEEIIDGFYERQKQEYSTAVTLLLAHMTRLKSDLQKKPLMIEDEIHFPMFERNVYFRASRDGVLKASKKLAFFNLGEAWGVLNFSEKALFYFNKTLGMKSTDTLDNNVEYLTFIQMLPFALKRYAVDELSDLFFKMVLFNSNDVKTNGEETKRAHFFEAVNNFNNDQGCSDLRAQIVFESLNTVDKQLQNLDPKAFDRKWFAIIRLLMFFLRDKFNSPIAPLRSSLLKEAYEAGIASECDEVIVQAGSNLGFFNIGSLKDVKALAEVHIKIMESLRSRWFNESHINLFGSNLCKVWRGIKAVNLEGEYKKIYDLLHFSAVRLSKSGINEELISAVMILLLASLNNSHGVAKEWAEGKICMAKETMPLDIKNFIEDVFNE